MDATAPTPVAGQDWRLSEDGGARRLAFGAEASGDLKLALDCETGAGHLELTAPATTPVQTLHLESGGETERYPVAAQPLEIADGVLLTGKAGTGDPVFQRFRKTGWLARWDGETRTLLTGHPGSLPDIQRFFDACG